MAARVGRIGPREAVVTLLVVGGALGSTAGGRRRAGGCQVTSTAALQADAFAARIAAGGRMVVMSQLRHSQPSEEEQERYAPAFFQWPKKPTPKSAEKMLL